MSECKFNVMTGSFEKKLSVEERAMRLVRRGMRFDEALLLLMGERQGCKQR